MAAKETYPVKFIFLFCFTQLFFAISCGTSQSEENISIDSITEVKLNPNKSKTGQTVVYTKYNLPLPIELYHFLKDEGIVFNNELLHPVNKASKYMTSVSKSINLGFYSSDLAYVTMFEENQFIVDYFAVTKKMAEELDISEGYDRQMFERLKANLNENDSLKKIASDSYWRTCRYLESNNNINILPFIVVGAWVESLHLTLNAANGKVPKTSIVNEIVRQKKSLVNLINYLFEVMADSNAYYLNVDIQKLIQKLSDIKESFDKLQENTAPELTEPAFTEVLTKIEKTRDYYTSL